MSLVPTLEMSPARVARCRKITDQLGDELGIDLPIVQKVIRAYDRMELQEFYELILKPVPNKLDDFLHEVATEVTNATAKWPPFNSAHEGFAVLLEEVDELKAHVWMNQKRRDPEAMRTEAKQVAAMAARFALEICENEKWLK